MRAWLMARANTWSSLSCHIVGGGAGGGRKWGGGMGGDSLRVWRCHKTGTMRIYTEWHWCRCVSELEKCDNSDKTPPGHIRSENYYHQDHILMLWGWLTEITSVLSLGSVLSDNVVWLRHLPVMMMIWCIYLQPTVSYHNSFLCYCLLCPLPDDDAWITREREEPLHLPPHPPQSGEPSLEGGFKPSPMQQWCLVWCQS